MLFLAAYQVQLKQTKLFLSCCKLACSSVALSALFLTTPFQV